MEKMKADIYNNNFSFVAINYENRTSYSAPAGTGRIISTNTPPQTEGVVGIIVSHDKLIMCQKLAYWAAENYVSILVSKA